MRAPSRWLLLVVLTVAGFLGGFSARAFDLADGLMIAVPAPKPFDFVGDIPGGKVDFTVDADGKGYTALMTIPRSFLEFPITAGTSLKGDVEVLLSGSKSQGLQTLSRNWLYSGGRVQTTMTDDVPTEAWLYPQFWGDVSVK